MSCYSYIGLNEEQGDLCNQYLSQLHTTGGLPSSPLSSATREEIVLMARCEDGPSGCSLSLNWSRMQQDGERSGVIPVRTARLRSSEEMPSMEGSIFHRYDWGGNPRIDGSFKLDFWSYENPWHTSGPANLPPSPISPWPELPRSMIKVSWLPVLFPVTFDYWSGGPKSLETGFSDRGGC